MENHNITIEDLAVMIKDGFDGVDKRFEQVDKRFEQVDKRFDAMDKRFDAMDKRFDKVEGDLGFLIDSSKRQFDDLCERLDITEKKIDGMGIMEKAIMAEIKAIRAKLETKADNKDFLELDNRVKKLEKVAFAKIH